MAIEVITQETVVEIIGGGGSGGASSLDDLSDVTIDEPTPTAVGTLRVLGDLNSDGNYTVFDWSPPSAGGGEINDGINLGAGSEIFAGKSTVNLQFRTLINTTEIVITQNANDLSFAVASNAIAKNKLDFIVNASLDLADTSLQPSAIGATVQAHSTILDNTTASYTTAQETKLAGIEDNATTDQTGAEIKGLYEAEPNTNAYIDVDKTKVDFVSITQPVDLDTLESQVATNTSDIALKIDDAPSDGNQYARQDATWTIVSGGGGASSLNDLSDVTIGTPTATAVGTLRVLGDLNSDGTYTVFDWSPPSAGGGEINDGENLGTGAEIFAGKSSVNLQFRTLINTTEIIITQNANDLSFTIAPSSIDESKLDASVNASLNLADASLQPSEIGTTVQAHSTILDNTTASYTTAEEAKLSGIEDNATADQTGAEIKALYEAEANTNAYIDVDKTKVDFVSITQPVDLDALETQVVTNTGDIATNTSDIALKIDDAPSDGNQYARQDATWTIVSGGGGASSLDDLSDVTIGAPTETAVETLRVLGDLNSDGTYTVFDWSPPSAGGGTQLEELVFNLTAPFAPASLIDSVINLLIPFDMTVQEVELYCREAPTGSNLIVDINKNAVSILSTKLSIDAGETSSRTATTPPVISDPTLSEGDILTIDFDQIGVTLPSTGVVAYVRGERI